MVDAKRFLLPRDSSPWERLLRSKGDGKCGRGKGSNPFSMVINCSIGLLKGVNHSPKTFAKLALGTDEVLSWSWPVVTFLSTLRPVLKHPKSGFTHFVFPPCCLQTKGSRKSPYWEIPLVLFGKHHLSPSAF